MGTGDIEGQHRQQYGGFIYYGCVKNEETQDPEGLVCRYVYDEIDAKNH